MLQTPLKATRRLRRNQVLNQTSLEVCSISEIYSFEVKIIFTFSLILYFKMEAFKEEKEQYNETTHPLSPDYTIIKILPQYSSLFSFSEWSILKQINIPFHFTLNILVYVSAKYRHFLTSHHCDIR